MPSYTPMMEQYFAIKNQYQHCLLMFRLGDFFEMFFDDAKTASRELDIALTGRECGQAERAPMCGVPAHAADAYISKLVEKGYHVAICDQVEDARFAKGIVKREVVRVVTPGTVTDSHMLDEGRNNYIACVFGIHNGAAQVISCASADITTGLFMVTAISDESKLLDELSRLHPAEIITHEGFPHIRLIEGMTGLKVNYTPMWTYHPAGAFKCLTSHFKTMHLEGYGLGKNAVEIPAAGALLHYLSETQKNTLRQITAIKLYSQKTRMILDLPSRRNLELTSAMHSRNKKDSLLGVLDRTKTAMGARLLRNWLELPLISPEDINKRLDAVGELKDNTLARTELRELLSGIHDLERLMARLASRYASARDLAALRASLQYLPSVGHLLSEFQCSLLKEIYFTFDDLSDIYTKIHAVLVENPPPGVREGGMIRQGYNEELDKLLDIKNNGTTWLSELEAREREETGIKNLKIRYNKIFGYYIEISNSNLSLAPARYTRRQTLANCERFITEELKNLEDTILNADEKQINLEFDLFDALRREVVEQMARIQFTAYALAAMDAVQSLSDAADRNRYIKPEVNNSPLISIKEGRHPVIEGKTEHPFIPNDTELDIHNRLAIITGPNMAGKSTYMRQVALIVLMAQIGSFVPAGEASIGVVDRIFTRVGASDDLATGQSTFMVEMTEVANILHNATSGSLILLDEIGRGTSTFDGLSIAWAVLEYIADKIKAKTLFATHYHELTELEGRVPAAANYCFTVQEWGEDIIFLRKLTRGGAGQSFGIHVARLAGLPPSVLKRASGLLSELNAADITKKPDGKFEPTYITEGPYGNADKNIHILLEAFSSMDVEKITPLEAIMELDRLKSLMKE